SAVREGTGTVAPGQPVRLSVVPSSAGDLRVTDLLDAPLRLTWITKQVRFSDHQIEPALAASPFDPLSIDALLTGGMPARVPVVGTFVGTENLPGTPGELVQLAGSFPIPVEVPVRLSIEWEVLDSDGATVLTEGPATFSAPGGMAAANLTVVFPPVTVELTSNLAAPLTRRFIRATITLSAGSTTHSFTLPLIPLDLVAVPIPSVVVFFLHAQLAARSGDDEGAAFIVVPNDSPIHSVEALQSTLSTLQSTLSSLTSIAEMAAFLAGLTDLSNALSAQPHVQFRVADSSNNFDNFNDVTLKTHWMGWLFGWTNTEAEDELSSMIFLGPQRKTVRCFNDRARTPGQGSFDLTIGPKLHAIIRDLHSATPVSTPDGTEISVVGAPPGGLFNPSTFGDALSSLRFT
ncbi:MAG TPA: hypothetical protein VHK90_11950, partial [Thermoanaerobaculia bacterium]|nr:hypothetical protein [Thermoanaerobaculia bacterium]